MLPILIIEKILNFLDFREQFYLAYVYQHNHWLTKGKHTICQSTYINPVFVQMKQLCRRRLI